MTDHIAVCEVEYHDVVFTALYEFDCFILDFVGTHFGFEVVSRDFGRRNKNSVLAFVGGFNAAVEEERNVRILFGFRNAELLLAAFCEIFTEGIDKRTGFERDFDVFERCVVTGEANVFGSKEARFTVKTVEFFLRKSTRHFAGTVGTEVVENHAVALFDFRDGRAVFDNDGGQHEFVRNALTIAFFDCFHCADSKVTLSEGKHIVSLFHAVPAVVAVHCVISAANGRNFASSEFCDVVFEFACITRRAFGRQVTAVEEAVYEHFFHFFAFCHFEQREQMFDVTVNSAGSEQTHKMQLFAVVARRVHSVEQNAVFKETAVGYFLGNVREVLINHSACTHIEVTDFAVAHLTRRKTNVKTACAERCMRIFCKQFVEVGGTLHGNRVVLTRRCDSEPVHYNQCVHNTPFPS